jgi:hypothetical protein
LVTNNARELCFELTAAQALAAQQKAAEQRLPMAAFWQTRVPFRIPPLGPPHDTPADRHVPIEIEAGRPTL